MLFAVGCIEDLREKREELNRSILRDEEEKGKIQKVRCGRQVDAPIPVIVFLPPATPHHASRISAC